MSLEVFLVWQEGEYTELGLFRGYSKDFFQLHKFHVQCKFEGGGSWSDFSGRFPRGGLS